MAGLTTLRVERLEARDVPSISTAGEEVYSLPHLDGMSETYPIDVGGAVSISIEDTPTEVEHDEKPSVAGAPLRAMPRPRFAVGSGAGRTTLVHVYDAETNALIGTVTPFGPAFTGGARVATADLTGDAIEDIVVAAGPGWLPLVQVYDGATLTVARAFFAYGEAFAGGVFVAAGDVTGDGRPDIITGAGAGGGPHVKMFSGWALFPQSDVWFPEMGVGFFAYGAAFAGGVSVAVGDANGDGRGDIVTGAGPGGGPHVMAFDGLDQSVLASFFAYEAGMSRGVMVTADDAVIATAPMAGGGPHVRTFTGSGEPVADYAPFDLATRSGASVALRDLDGDGRSELLASTGPGVAPRVRVLDVDTGAAEREFPSVMPDYLGGLFVG